MPDLCSPTKCWQVRVPDDSHSADAAETTSSGKGGEGQTRKQKELAMRGFVVSFSFVCFFVVRSIIFLSLLGCPCLYGTIKTIKITCWAAAVHCSNTLSFPPPNPILRARAHTHTRTTHKTEKAASSAAVAVAVVVCLSPFQAFLRYIRSK